MPHRCAPRSSGAWGGTRVSRVRALPSTAATLGTRVPRRPRGERKGTILTGEGRPYTVLAFGELNVDLILSGMTEPPKFGGEVLAEQLGMHAGGSTANVAACCAQLGMATTLVSNVGSDSFGDFLVGEMERLGVATSHILRHNRLRTGITVSISMPDDRAFVTHVGTIDSLTAQDATDDLLRQTRHLHVGSYFLQSRLRPGLADVFERAHETGTTVSLDTGYDPAEEWDGGLLELLPLVDVFLPNETEAAGITGRDDPRAALRELSRHSTVAVVKLGPQGAIAAADDGTYECPGLTVEVADTTCCGDAFNAGFLSEWLAGKSIEECLCMGNACGALVATEPGNSAGLLAEDGPARLLQGRREA
jgi:sugar/nucleoside kinase (ribokinase family)